ncbi:MAG TPA: hypothetical protein VMY77_13065 [Chitinophagaceae bacterium]|nr:hypothetical protein [Chitinophagaceae bacterium]
MKFKLFSIILLFSFYDCSAQASDTAAARLNNYRDKVFGVFNKCNSHDEEITKAIKEKNVAAIEAGRIALLQCAVEGVKQLSAIEDYDWDPSLKFSCRDVLKFYKQLAESDLPQVRDFFIVEVNFFKIQKEFKKKPVKKHSQSEIIAYNSEVNRYNQAVTRYTQHSNFIASGRKLTLYNWNASQKIFMDTHRSK